MIFITGKKKKGVFFRRRWRQVKSKTKLNKKSMVKRLKDFAAHSKLKSQHLRNLPVAYINPY
jgi:hypothetical protein